MIHNNKHYQNSIYSEDSTMKTIWNRLLSHLFHSTQGNNNRRLSTYSSESDSSVEIRPRHRRKRTRKEQALSLEPTHLVLPPFSPTYCKANEFPYSNFYMKLPNGKWMIRYRSGNRDILGTEEFEGYMI